MTLKEIEEKLKESLSETDYDHSRRVAQASVKMARTFSVDPEQAWLAGLLHDCARGMSDAGLLEEAGRLGLEIGPVERAYPYLLHASVGACLVPESFGVDESAVLRAIERHTLGAPDMTALEKILYLADKTEDGRRHTGVERVRELAARDLDAAFAEAYAETLGQLVRKRRLIHPRSVEVWNSLLRNGERDGRR